MTSATPTLDSPTHLSVKIDGIQEIGHIQQLVRLCQLIEFTHVVGKVTCAAAQKVSQHRR